MFWQILREVINIHNCFKFFCVCKFLIVCVCLTGKIEPMWARQLAETPTNRYSFVCNTVVAVCNESDNDRLNDIAILSAELTACCNALSAEWLGVLMALCCSSNHTYFVDVLAQIDVRDTSIHNSLAVFTSILIARHCFSLGDFVRHIALPSLVKAGNEVKGDSEAAAGARLTCHLLLRLFKTVECPQPSLYSVGTSPPHPLPGGTSTAGMTSSICLSCDRHLLAAAHNSIRVGPVLAVLKAILVVADATASHSKTLTSVGPMSNKKSAPSPAPGSMTPNSASNSGSSKGAAGGPGELSISHILGTSDILGGGDDLMDLGGLNGASGLGGPGGGPDMANIGLSDFAQHVLREICSQEWVLERCLQNPENLCHQDLLLDSMLSAKQAQRLLHMICYPATPVGKDDNLDQKAIITNILENLDQWTLRMSWVDMQLMYEQFRPNSSELNQWLDMVAKAVIDVFQLNCAEKEDKRHAKSGTSKEKSNTMWLVALLVSKLPSAVQGRVLRVAGKLYYHYLPGLFVLIY